jgi:PAS domain S-box-containing protein
MPPNDFLIHGNEIEIQNFDQILDTIKSELRMFKELSELSIIEININDLNLFLVEIESRGRIIFNLHNPVGNQYGAIIMEEMDRIVEDVVILIEKKIGASKEHIRDDILMAHRTYIRYTRIIVYVGLIIVFALLIGGFFYVRDITKPIHQLKLTTQKISNSAQLEETAVRSRDEIEDLANSFNQMINVLEKTTVNRKYFSTILNRMEDSLIITDAENRIKIVNQATLKLLGYTEEEIIGRAIGSITSLKDKDEKSGNIDALSAKGTEGNINNVYNTYYSKEGKPIPVSYTQSVISDSYGQSSGLILIAHSNSGIQHETNSIEEEDKNFKKIKTCGDIPLTKRELEIMRLIAKEYSNQEIAEKLFISVRTVETHRRNIMQKLHMNSVISLVHYAIQNRII